MSDIDKATEAVERQLRIGQFINAQKDAIFEKIEQCYRHVRDEDEAQMMFVAESLPLISGIIHVGSGFDDFRRAREWVRSTLPAADPVAVLSTLTLVYVVEKGWEEHALSDDDERRMIWTQMHENMLTLLQPR